MRKHIYFFSLILMGVVTKAQTFWTEDFGTNPVCGTVSAAAYTGTNGAWTTSLTGTNQTFANEWYVSAVEAGMGVGNCGDGCSSNPTLINRTLHVSTAQSFLGDQGATYYAGPGASTDVRAQSPLINCTGKNSITMAFNYFVVGVANQDYCEMMYSSNGGLTWSTLGTAPITTLGACSPQGKWVAYSVALPAACNNNANVKVGFRWQHVSASGADPCIALDDIALSTPASTSLTPTFTLAASICRGDSTQVTANTGTYVVSGYTWTAAPVGPVIATPNASVTWVKFPTTGTFSITLTATSGTQIASVTHTILVNPTPTVNASANSSIICAGNSSTLTAFSISPGLSYTWMPVGGNLPSVIVTPSITSTYSVTGTNTVTGCKNTRTISVTVNPNPTVNVVATSSAMCAGSGNSATLTASTSGPPLTYSWAPVSSGNASVAVAPTVTTTYSVTGTNTVTGCKDTKTISITINPQPTLAIMSSTNNLCVGSSASFTVSGASTYSWAPNSATTAVVMVSPSVTTTYTVVGTSAAGCSKTQTFVMTVTNCGGAGLTSYHSNELSFTIYPNPAKDKASIKAGDMNLNNVKVELFDLLGKKLSEQTFANIPAGNEQSIQVSTLPKGIFILNMSVDGVPQKSVRLVKE
jgi:hypothetical protein